MRVIKDRSKELLKIYRIINLNKSSVPRLEKYIYEIKGFLERHMITNIGDKYIEL